MTMEPLYPYHRSYAQAKVGTMVQFINMGTAPGHDHLRMVNREEHHRPHFRKYDYSNHFNQPFLYYNKRQFGIKTMQIHIHRDEGHSTAHPSPQPRRAPPRACRSRL